MRVPSECQCLLSPITPLSLATPISTPISTPFANVCTHRISSPSTSNLYRPVVGKPVSRMHNAGKPMPIRAAFTPIAAVGATSLRVSLPSFAKVSHRSASSRTFSMDHRLSTMQNIEWFTAPVVLSGKVQQGFGRGSRDLGTPTANLSGKLASGVAELQRDGVYLGYGRVPKFGGDVVKMVANLGRNITYGDVTERVLEAYLMHEYATDFYGEEMRLCIIGFMRPELKFESLDELIKHINNDVLVSKSALDLPRAAQFQFHPTLTL